MEEEASLRDKGFIGEEEASLYTISQEGPFLKTSQG